MRLIALNLALGLVLTLTACGGGDDDTPSTPTEDTAQPEADASSGGDDTAVAETPRTSPAARLFASRTVRCRSPARRTPRPRTIN